MKPFPSPSVTGICLMTVLSLTLFTGCTSVQSKRERSAAQATDKPAAERIHWPENYLPEQATFFVHNEIEIITPPQVVWDILVQAEAWPKWYVGALNVTVLHPAGSRLAADGVFAWNTMDLDFESRIKEFAPPFRLSWESRKYSIKGYHAWLIIPTDKGCHVITDESQNGLLALAQKIFLPNKLRKLHDVWLGELKKQAEAAVTQPAAK
jgi:uncharacterized protein YndB with AHSA1/START domain